MPDPLFAPWALVLIPLGYFSLFPLISRLMAGEREELCQIEVGLLAFALSPALLTVILFWIGILPGSWVTPWSALIIVAALWTVSLLANPGWLRSLHLLAAALRFWRSLSRLDVQSLMLWTIIGAGWIMLIHALYYPFIGDDTLSRYALMAKRIYLTHRIPPDVNGYPLLVPLGWVSTWFAAGHLNEHLARVYSMMLTIACIGATYLLGREVGGKRLGLAAALLLAVTPVFFIFGTLDFVDVPTAFPLTLAVLYVLRWWKTNSVRDALWAGILFGVAMFTKQAALPWVGSFVGVLALWLINALRAPYPGRWQHFSLSFAAFFFPVMIIATPWYIRNFIITGLWFPVSGLWHMLGDTAGILGGIPPIARVADFSYYLTPVYAVGWIIGIVLAVWQGIQLLRAGINDVPTRLILGLFVVPYWLVWWYRFSFEAHYLLIILPVMAVWAAEPVVWVLDWINQRVRVPALAARLGISITLLALLYMASRERLGGVYYALTRPFALEADRVRHVQPVLYDFVAYIERHMNPETDRILAMDVRLPYYLPEYNISAFYPQKLSELEGYDYLVHVSSLYGIYDGRLGWDQSEFFQHVWDTEYFEPVYESGGVHIMRILPARLGETP